MSIFGNPVLLGSGGGGGGSSHVHFGTTAPTADIGVNGDFYIREYALPSNVNFVDYLQNSGTQWIETGITGDQDTSLFVDQYWNNTAAVVARQSASVDSVGVGNQSPSILSLDFGTTRNTSTPQSGDRIQCTTGNFYRLLNGEMIGSSIEATFTTPTTFRLFAINAANSYGFVIQNGAKLCRVTIREGGAVIKDYLPALDTNSVACMYEAVAGEFVYNSGSGDFTYGDTVYPVPAMNAYVKSGGAWNLLLQYGENV